MNYNKTKCLRFERNGPNSTLQVDDNKKIVNTPDGNIFSYKSRRNDKYCTKIGTKLHKSNFENCLR